MRKRKTSPKASNIDTSAPYDHAMYEHEHKENSKKDLLENKNVISRESYDEIILKMLRNGLYDERH